MNENHEYKGWLNSNSFFKRAFGIWGYYFVANLIIGLAVGIIAIIVMLVIGVGFGTFGN